MKAEIQSDYEEFEVHEISVDCSNGYSYLIIYGQHVNGWFIALPSWKKCVEAANPINYQYNTEKLSDVFNNADIGKALAMAVKEHWEG